MIEFSDEFEQDDQIMKVFQLFLVAAFSLAFFAVSADAQRRTTTRRPAPPKVVTTTNIPQPAPAAIKSGSEKVSIQIKNVTKFLYLLGGVARGIEDLDKDPRANQAAKTTNDENKRALMQTIRNLRAGMAALEVEFRTNAALKPHLVHIQGIADLTGQTEQLANTGRYSDSGKPLLLVVERLSDTLAAL